MFSNSSLIVDKNMNVINKLIDRINQEQRIISLALFTHKGCDYDAVASLFSLANYFQRIFNSNVKIFPIIEKNDFSSELINEVPIINDIEKIDFVFDYGIVLDVNECDRLYGIELLDNIPISNRFLCDHHIGNRKELEVLDENKWIDSTSSSTSELIARTLILNNDIDFKTSYNLYIGIVSDTAGFTRQTTETTKLVCDMISLDEDKKREILLNIITLTPYQQQLYDEIEEIPSRCSELSFFKLTKTEDFIKDLNLIKNEKVEEKIKPDEGKVMSCLFVECGDYIFIKFRKNANSSIDIISIAEKCNGGGHNNRCAGRFYQVNFSEVINYVENIYEKEKIKKIGDC